MELALTSELQQKLAHLAARRGTDSPSLAVEAIERMLEYEEWFLGEVNDGIQAADRGDLVEHAEVQMLLSRLP